MMACIRLTLLCWYLVGVTVRKCQPVELDVNANLQHNLAHKDLEQALENADLQVVDKQRMLVNHRMSNTSDDAAPSERIEADRQINDRTHAKESEEKEEEEEEEEDDEEKEEEWLPVNDGGKQKINGQHREGRRVRRNGEGKRPELEEEAANGQLQYTTLDPGNQGDPSEELTEAGSDEADASGEGKEGKNDTETSKDNAKGSEDEHAKEIKSVKEHDGAVNVKAEAPSDDDIGDTSAADATQNEKAASKHDDTSKKYETQKKDDISNEDDTSKNEKVQSKNGKQKPTKILKEGKKRKEEVKVTSRSGKTVPIEGAVGSINGSAKEHLGNADESKGQKKKPADDDNDGSGDEEDEGNIFINHAPASTDDVRDDSPAADENEELIGSEVSNEEEAKKLQTVTPKENSEKSKDKQQSIEEDKKDDEQDSRGSDKDDEGGSGELEKQSSESSEEELRNQKKEYEKEKDDTAIKKPSTGNNWKYYGPYGPGNWSMEFSGCNNNDHRFQSPINIIPEQTRLDDTREKITFSMKHSEKPCNSILFNGAQTAKVIFENMAVHVIGLDKSYQVAEVQFHWGSTNNVGSEHVIADKRYPLEMQVVCYDEENFPDLMEAERAGDNTSSTIVVLATLFELSDLDNGLLSSVVDNLKSVWSPGQNISIPPLNLKGLLPKNSDFFYRYSGSLTSPPCQAGAEWIIFHEHQTISPSQLEKFRQLHEEEFEDGNFTTIDYNWRPVQQLNDRVVTRSFPILQKGNPKTQNPITGKIISNSSSHQIPAIDITVYTLLVVYKLFLG